MFNAFAKTILTMMACVAVVGCGNNDGDKFVGHWVAVEKTGKDYIDVKKEGDLYHFDYSFNQVFLGPNSYEVERYEGSPVSESVMRLGGVPGYDVRLEDGIIYFRDSGYKKTK